jgi:hypothetical protein
METFQAVGIALVAAAIVGGGLEAAGFKIRVVESLPRQLMLAGLGAVVFLFGTPEVWSWTRSAPASAISSVSGAQPAPPTVTPLPSPSATAPATATLAPSATATAEPTATSTPSATETPVPATSAPVQAATQAPAGRTPILPGIRKDGDRRP